MGIGIGQLLKSIGADKNMSKMFFGFAENNNVEPTDIDIILRLVNGKVNIFVYCKKTGETLERIDLEGFFNKLMGGKTNGGKHSIQEGVQDCRIDRDNRSDG
jgi:hypothetical protein